MNPSDPQFVYMVLILPSMFGVTMVGEGVSRVMRSQSSGWISVVMGVAFMMAVGIAYLFLAGIL